jgi:hypothetical protein
MIAEGVLDITGLEQIIVELSAEGIRHTDCKVVIAFTETQCVLDLGEINQQIVDLWPRECKTALMCLSDYEYSRLSLVSARLASNGIRIAVFPDARAAIEWLDEVT